MARESDRKRATEMVGKKSVTFPVVLDSGSVRRRYGAELFGGCFLVGKDGKVEKRFTMYRSGSERVWEAEARRLLAAGQ